MSLQTFEKLMVEVERLYKYSSFEELYKYFDKNANMLFTFEKGGIGVCSIGECWRLRLTFSNQQTLVACFVTYDDHHNAAKQYSLHGRIWSEREALSEANKMVAEFIED